MASPDIFESHNRLLFRVLMTDSRVGLTFAHLASEAVVGSEKRIPNQMNVHKVYGIVLSVRQNESLCGGESGGGRRSGQIEICTRSIG